MTVTASKMGAMQPLPLAPSGSVHVARGVDFLEDAEGNGSVFLWVFCPFRGSLGRRQPRQWGCKAGAVQHDHGDEALWVVEAPGVGSDAADDGVRALRQSVRQLPFQGRLYGGPVGADGPGELHERGEAGPAGVAEPVVESPAS